MQGLSLWISSILAVAIIGVIADLILSGNRMHKFVRGIFGVVMLFVISAPLPSLICSGFKWDFDWGGSVEIDQGWLDQVQKKQMKILEDGTVQLLARNGIDKAKVTIQGTVDNLIVNITQVTVNLLDAVINNNNPHIDIKEVVLEIVTSGLNVDQSIVVIILGS
ncbi:MAG: stage III sporulation protein AF [Firmicutes bacterium]|nr:stage III sporulation protein AF [Bacillota bacterium]